MTRRLAIPLALIALLGCERVGITRGGQCELNSDCASPLVCELGNRCRRQCIDSRDCGAGLLCLRVGAMGGVCQLDEEARCNLTSECQDDLVCRFGTCTTACVEDRDCVAGALCQHDDDDGTACIEPTRELCIYDSDCPEPFVCGADQQCGLECRVVEGEDPNRDCPAPRVCVENLCQLPDGGL